MGGATSQFTALAKLYAGTPIAFPVLKDVTLAQWILESGYGQSRLAIDHGNYGGLKWRSEMAGFAKRVKYDAHDGTDYYCAFADHEAFIKGYWRFLDRDPYKGWKNSAGSAADFIRFIGPIYTPTHGYADSVLNLVPRARALMSETGLRASASEKPPGTAELYSKPAIKEFIQSPNCSSRNGAPIRRIVLHYTTSRNVEGTISWFKNPKSQVSAHYVIARNGDIYQMVRDSDKAWHAKNANTDSIGIEHSAASGDRMTSEQDAASVALIRWLLSEYKLNKTALHGHRFTPENAGTTDCPGDLFGARTEKAVTDWVNSHV